MPEYLFKPKPIWKVFAHDLEQAITEAWQLTDYSLEKHCGLLYPRGETVYLSAKKLTAVQFKWFAILNNAEIGGFPYTHRSLSAHKVMTIMATFKLIPEGIYVVDFYPNTYAQFPIEVVHSRP